MIDLFQFALNSIDIGIIIIDSNQSIKFWNKYMERISQIHQKDAVGKLLPDVCNTFKKKRYQDILESVLVYNQSRFCSSKLHKAFVYPYTGENSDIRQNMKIEPTHIEDKVYALIQINDITLEVNNEYKMTSLINELKKGYLEVKESEEINRQLASMDPLTKIANRHAITQYLSSLFQNDSKLNGKALIFLDLDGFKFVNDTYGHLMGDNLLVQVSQILKNKVRREDFVARLGGDEFLILLNDVGSVEALKVVGSKLVSEIAKPIVIDGTELHVTVSIGIALYNDKIKSANNFIKSADDAMYLAKRGGKNQYVIFS
ncbi:MAG TPA: GGDEF domain-containing protein [Ruminiclostridium sp.]|nr:GGDEF domain-containing protein [Ruminiclostridium sp.]